MAKRKSATQNGATIGCEAQLWAMADALRGSMDAAEYQHAVLGLIFLKEPLHNSFRITTSVVS